MASKQSWVDSIALYNGNVFLFYAIYDDCFGLKRHQIVTIESPQTYTHITHKNAISQYCCVWSAVIRYLVYRAIRLMCVTKNKETKTIQMTHNWIANTIGSFLFLSQARLTCLTFMKFDDTRAWKIKPYFKHDDVAHWLLLSRKLFFSCVLHLVLSLVIANYVILICATHIYTHARTYTSKWY